MDVMMQALLVPSLRFENWRSMEVYEDFVREGLEAMSGIRVSLPVPAYRMHATRAERFWKKYIAYRAKIDREWKSAGPRGIVHHLDHGYAHLVAAHQRTVVTVHDLTHFEFPELSGYKLAFWRLRMRCLQKSDHLVAVSQNVADLLTKHLGIDPEKITVIYHEIHSRRFLDLDREAAHGRWEEQLRGKDTEILLASVGTTSPKKNLIATLRAVLECRRMGRRVRLVRVGETITSGEEFDLARVLRQEGLLIELGYRSHAEVAEILSLADVLSFPSKYEGFGMPLMEAQALGLPLVVARASCLPEIAGEEGALFHDPDDAGELARQILRVQDDAVTREAIRQAGFKNLQRFAPGSHVAGLVAVYNKLLGGGGES